MAADERDGWVWQVRLWSPDDGEADDADTEKFTGDGGQGSRDLGCGQGRGGEGFHGSLGFVPHQSGGGGGGRRGRGCYRTGPGTDVANEGEAEEGRTGGSE